MFGRHKFKFVIAATLFGILFLLWPRPVPEGPGMHLDEGLKALERKEYSTAEQHFRAELRLVPREPIAGEKLARLLIQSGRSWEASRHVQSYLSRTDTRQDTLALLTGDPQKSIDERILEDWQLLAPSDPIPLIGVAKIAMANLKTEEARELINKVLAVKPDELEAHVVLGQLILATNPSELMAWNQHLPESASGHPGIWFIRGDWCRQTGERQMAARCFLEGLRLDPNDRSANLRLGQLLGPERGAPFLERADHLRQMFDQNAFVQRRSSLAQAWELVKSLQALGRAKEAALWSQMAMTANPQLMFRMTQDREFADSYAKIMVEAGRGKDLNPAAKIDLLEFPPWQPPEVQTVSAETSAVPDVRFRDDAMKTRLDFTYFNADDPATGGKRMQEWTGGGVGVLDLDQDGWPDLYLAQGCAWPPSESADLKDQVFRNRQGQYFVNSTTESGLGDPGFSQGVTVADFDNDGFDDVYVGNIGPNRLYHGNGDGTFSDVTEPGCVPGDEWTTSCTQGDFNGDSLTDLFVVNYLHGAQIFEVICENKNLPVTCAPSNFEATDDRLLINLGDGRFEDQSSVSGILLPKGPGLGVVAAQLTADNLPDVFVANDQEPNFYFVNQSSPESKQLIFHEQAVSKGLAFDGEGRAQACMGVAIGDLNADSSPDLFVTNFANESNTLYLSLPDGTFDDATSVAGLAKPSYAMLGFGTAFFDADLDGRLDLVVANGHIGDHRAFGQQYRMPPQFFYNTGSPASPRFTEVPASKVGPWFETECLGRGLAVLDWNRDARPDFAVSHLDTPVALLTNESEMGHFLALRLCGVKSSREAIGTRVRIVAGELQWNFQLTGGGSYQSSSQRSVLCGLGKATKVDQLVLSWPSGETQSFADIEVDQMLTVIEGRSQFTVDAESRR